MRRGTNYLVFLPNKKILSCFLSISTYYNYSNWRNLIKYKNVSHAILGVCARAAVNVIIVSRSKNYFRRSKSNLNLCWLCFHVFDQWPHLRDTIKPALFLWNKFNNIFSHYWINRFELGSKIDFDQYYCKRPEKLAFHFHENGIRKYCLLWLSSLPRLVIILVTIT